MEGGLKISAIEVIIAIAQLAYNSGGIDLLVPVKVAKNLKTVLSMQLSIFFTFICMNSIIPKCCKSAVITPLFKGKGSKFLAKNFRPISGLNIYCKILERILYNRLQIRVDAMLNPNQHAYRHRKSCNTALYELNKYMYEKLDQPKAKVGAVFVDLRKAFDSVNRKLLIKKLMIYYNLEPEYVKLIENYLTGRIIKLKGDTKYFESPTGIPQGSALGPLLFSMFFNDVCNVINVQYLLYADDLVFYTSDVNEDVIMRDLRCNLERTDFWCQENFA